MPKLRTCQGSRGASNQGRGLKGLQGLGSPQGEQGIRHWLEKGIQARGLLQLLIGHQWTECFPRVSVQLSSQKGRAEQGILSYRAKGRFGAWGERAWPQCGAKCSSSPLVQLIRYPGNYKRC